MLLALIAVLWSASPPAQGGGVERVSPKFAWPRGLAGVVEVRQTADKLGQPHVELTTRCKMHVQPHMKGLLVTCREATVTPEFGGEFAAVSTFLRTAAEFDWLVSEAGEFITLTSTERMMEAMWKLPGPAKLDGAERKRVGEVSLELANADARTTWTMLVEAWKSSSFALGEELVDPIDVDTPLAPGAPVRGRQTARAERWLECPGPARSRCLEIRGTTVGDPAALAAVVQRFFDKNAIKPLDKKVNHVQFSREIVLVTDPSTLVPYSLSTKTLSSASAGDELLASQAVEKRWTFFYPPTEPPPGK